MSKSKNGSESRRGRGKAFPFYPFLFIDSWAGYIGKKWDMKDPVTLRKINFIHSGVVLFEAIIFFYLLSVQGYI